MQLDMQAVMVLTSGEYLSQAYHSGIAQVKEDLAGAVAFASVGWLRPLVL
jgi:hypothetical protein